MANPLVSVGPGGLVTSGLFNSVNQHAVPLWADGRNIVFKKAGVEKAPGYAELVAFPDEILALSQAFIAGERRAYGATSTEIYIYRGGELNQIGAILESPAPQLEVWGSFLLVNDQQTFPKYWPNAGSSLIDIPTPFDYAKLLKRKDVFVLAANTSNGGAMIEWCSASNIADWEPTAINSAGNFFVRDLDGDIIAVQDLGDSLAFYSSDNMVIGRYTGPPFFLSFKKALNGIGALGRGAIVSLGGNNLGLGQQGIWRTDGSQFIYVDDPALTEWLQSTLDLSKPNSVNSYYHDTLGLAIWHFEDKDGNVEGVGYSPTTNTLTRINYGLVAALEREVFTTPLGAVGNSLVSLDTGYNFSGDAQVSWIRTKPLDAGAPEMFKLWDGLRSMIRAGSTGEIKVYVCDDPEGAQELIYSGDMAHTVPFLREAGYIVIEYRSEDVDSFFKLSGFIIDGMPGGPIGD